MCDIVNFWALGGLNEVGNSGYVYRSGYEVIIVDCGIEIGADSDPKEILRFLQIPKDCRLIATFITHAHLDHMASADVLANKFDIPVYISEFGNELFKAYLEKNNKNARIPKIRILKDNDNIEVGNFIIVPYEVAHSIPDAFGLEIKTKGRVMMNSGDAKLTAYKEDSREKNLTRLKEIGKKQIDLLVQDTLCVNRPGITPAEERVVLNLLDLISQAPDSRHFIFTSGTNLRRIINIWMRLYRDGINVLFGGTAMHRMANIVSVLIKKENVDKILKRTDTHTHVFFCTGAQGEPGSFVTKLARLDAIPKLQKDDRVYFSAVLIPPEDNNEELWQAKLNRFRNIIIDLLLQGVQVYLHHGQQKLLGLGGSVKTEFLHVGGHESREGIKLTIKAVMPKKLVGAHTPRVRMPLVKKLVDEINQEQEEKDKIEFLEIDNNHIIEL